MPTLSTKSKSALGALLALNLALAGWLVFSPEKAANVQFGKQESEAKTTAQQSEGGQDVSVFPASLEGSKMEPNTGSTSFSPPPPQQSDVRMAKGDRRPDGAPALNRTNITSSNQGTDHSSSSDRFLAQTQSARPATTRTTEATFRGSELKPALQAEVIVTAAPVPLSFHEPDTTSTLSDDQRTRLEGLRQKFVKDVGGPDQDPNDPVYLERWQYARTANDELFRTYFGDEAVLRREMGKPFEGSVSLQ